MAHQKVYLRPEHEAFCSAQSLRCFESSVGAETQHTTQNNETTGSYFGEPCRGRGVIGFLAGVVERWDGMGIGVGWGGWPRLSTLATCSGARRMAHRPQHPFSMAVNLDPLQGCARFAALSEDKGTTRAEGRL